jgi:hypothetical protein
MRVADEIQERAGVPVLVCDPDGPVIATTRDALDLIGATYLGAEAVAVPLRRLDERFFSLGTRVAGEIMQKFVNYRLTLVIVGDISELEQSSRALRDLVRESNRGGHVWFVPDLNALDERLRGAA